ncbi:MAG: 23S rRNA (pseudouridine(1915)-N(3))-methyltransferase RlmH [Acetobacteraceae bacterium]|nr:23S rRNA (pseudouridine(1915)-N(3))-methyltransferase RlmH [Acetobacteraceae bacterium]
MLLIAVGKLRPGPERTLFDRYAVRLRPKLDVREVSDAPGSPQEAKRREGARILAALPSDALAVALDLGGQSLTSEGLAAQLARWYEQPHPLAFMIGGAEGLSGPVLDRAAFRLALGPLTWPHMLARILLIEQLYRAQTILAGHPYHRG